MHAAFSFRFRLPVRVDLLLTLESRVARGHVDLVDLGLPGRFSVADGSRSVLALLPPRCCYAALLPLGAIRYLSVVRYMHVTARVRSRERDEIPVHA